jgi:hypothetical protein
LYSAFFVEKDKNLAVKQSTTAPPEAAGITFAAGVMKREKKLILGVRECVTSYTAACIIEVERAHTLRSSISTALRINAPT